MTDSPNSDPTHSNLTHSAPSDFPAWLLNTGFAIALILAIACLTLGATYLFLFQSDTRNAILPALKGTESLPTGGLQLAITAQMYTARITLLSCGVFVGMAFGFIGFALFLLGIKGEVAAEGSSTSLKIKFERLSPGLFVILCSTILVGVCATRSLPFNYSQRAPTSYTFSDKDISDIDSFSDPPVNDNQNTPAASNTSDAQGNTAPRQQNNNKQGTSNENQNDTNKPERPAKGRADERHDPRMP